MAGIGEGRGGAGDRWRGDIRIPWEISLTPCDSFLKCAPLFGPWGRSSVGRAPQWHCGGRKFESCRLHHPFRPVNVGSPNVHGLLLEITVITCGTVGKIPVGRKAWATGVAKPSGSPRSNHRNGFPPSFPSEAFGCSRKLSLVGPIPNGQPHTGIVAIWHHFTPATIR